jgi:hypothetical protein
MANHTGETEARIQHIEAMMRNFTWRRGLTGRGLAVEWDLCEQRVGELAAEASKRIRQAIMNPEEVNAAVGAALEKALADAMTDGNLKVVAQLAKTWADISGASAPKKIEHSGGVTLAELDEERRKIAEANTALDK